MDLQEVLLEIRVSVVQCIERILPLQVPDSETEIIIAVVSEMVAQEDSETEIQEDSEMEIPEVSDRGIPADSDKETLVASETVIPEVSDKETREDSVILYRNQDRIIIISSQETTAGLDLWIPVVSDPVAASAVAEAAAASEVAPVVEAVASDQVVAVASDNIKSNKL